MMRVATQAATEACCAPLPAVSEVEVPDDVRLAALAKALGHPVRVRMLRMLASRRSCMTGEMVAHFELAQSTISEHLRVLKAAGLIQGEIEGPRTSYCLSGAGLASLRAGIESLTAGAECLSQGDSPAQGVGGRGSAPVGIR
jgi:ArsR family transcriptional regulator